MKYLAIITARTNSKRLPGKVLLRIKKTPIIQIIVERIKKSKKVKKIVISTTNKASDDALVTFLKKKKSIFLEEMNLMSQKG